MVNKKLIYRGELSKRGWDWTVCRFKLGGVGLAKKEGDVSFVGGQGDTPMHTMAIQ